MGGPRYHVNGSGVQREVEDLSPCAATSGGGGILGLFSPDQNFAVVGRGGQDGSKLRVCLLNNANRDQSMCAHIKTISPYVELTHATHHTAPS